MHVQGIVQLRGKTMTGKGNPCTSAGHSTKLCEISLSFPSLYIYPMSPCFLALQKATGRSIPPGKFCIYRQHIHSTFISLLIKAYATSKFMCQNTYMDHQTLLRKYSYRNIKGQITQFKSWFKILSSISHDTHSRTCCCSSINVTAPSTPFKSDKTLFHQQKA